VAGGSNTDDGSSKTALWVILGIALGILGISALAFVVYSIIKQKPWIRYGLTPPFVARLAEASKQARC
jgi:hypothetical protein